ncbi:hypothetical protein [Pedobacter endophyticus]|uniref:hypothetical protein n=1 Tax=Pedobacter endophyticus TaxID=2789740 RepID=UPI001E4A11C1|nr:hypothetical protein [Pedobacter endophyticus]
MKEGKLIEEGTHTELVELEGLYTNMWRKQSPSITESINRTKRKKNEKTEVKR